MRTGDDCQYCGQDKTSCQCAEAMTDDKKREDLICCNCGSGRPPENSGETCICGGKFRDTLDPIRAAAEKMVIELKMGVINRPTLEEGYDIAEQAIRAEVERECLDALCQGCKLGLEADSKHILCRGCWRLGHILDRIRQGGA